MKIAFHILFLLIFTLLSSANTELQACANHNNIENSESFESSDQSSCCDHSNDEEDEDNCDDCDCCTSGSVHSVGNITNIDVRASVSPSSSSLTTFSKSYFHLFSDSIWQPPRV